MNEEAMMWFDGFLFQCGTEKEFIEANKKMSVREICGFKDLTIYQAKQIVENLNKSNVLETAKSI